MDDMDRGQNSHALYRRAATDGCPFGSAGAAAVGRGMFGESSLSAKALIRQTIGRFYLQSTASILLAILFSSWKLEVL
jgi:hypothetical protein